LQEYEGKDGSPSTIADSVTRATDWIISRLSDNTEGLLEHKAAIPKGLENQVWKDSWDAYFHKDGRIANHEKGVASIEVQRLAYDALLDAARLYETSIIAQPMYAAELRTSAERLRETIFKHFWTDDQGGYFVLGTDRDDGNTLRQLAVRTSNMGHTLHSNLLLGDEPHLKHIREAIVRQLFSPEMLAPYGIRTLASDEVRFRPGAYHNGSVWLWDTHFIAKGLRKHGYYQLADILSERLFEVINTTMSFPEFIRGDDSPAPTLNNKIVDVWDEKYQRPNRIEQPPQEVQAWSVAAILALKHYNRSRHGLPKRPIRAFEKSILDRLK
jgi:glycogen debranching enzyme